MFPKILTLDATGQPHSWIDWETAVVLKVKGRISWEAGTPDIIIRGGISRMSGEQSYVGISSIVALKKKYHRVKPVTLNNHNLFRRDLCTCGYCGKVYREDKLSRDHIIPRKQGGKDIWENVITACKPCNNYKDAKTPDEADMPLRFQPYVPSKFEELVLKNKNILPCQLEYLSSYLPVHSRLIPK